MHKIKSQKLTSHNQTNTINFISKASILTDTFGNRIHEPWSDKYAVYFLFGPTKNEQKSS